MRVLAATFDDEAAAQRVLGQLREAYQLGRTDAQLAPLGAADSAADQRILLAGRFYDERVASVRELVEREGGRVVVDVDEAATKRRETPLPASRAEEAPRPPSRLRDRGELTRVFF